MSGAEPPLPPSEAAAAYRRRIRWSVYTLLICLSVGQATGRLMAVNAVDHKQLERYRINQRLSELRKQLSADGASGDEITAAVDEQRAYLEDKLRLQRPFLSANDRSRWLAVRALVEHGTYAIDDVYGEPTWDSIDIVQHRGRNGELHLYSSKPPLLYTLLAGEYWLINRATGMTLGTHPYVVGRAMLLTASILPLALMLTMVAALVERFGTNDLGRVFVVASASFGTMLSAFAVVLNNHIIAAAAAAVALYAFTRIRVDGDERRRWYLLAGLAAGFMAANELPALSLTASLGFFLLLRNPRATVVHYGAGVLVVAAAFFATNWVAHQSLRPAYMHRNPDKPGISHADNDDWYRFDITVGGRTRPSYWSRPGGIDRGEPDLAKYTMHCLVGHHGIFSMTPVWLLSFAGAAAMLFKPGAKREIGLMTIALTIVCLVFYIAMRPQVDRNYGGMTNGLRWMFWFAPLWLAAMTP
ncbi:MAG: hypothetical protein AAGG46_09665, partial [Planctomycetota bacterium]